VTASCFLLMGIWLALDRRELARRRSTILAWAAWGLAILGRFHMMFAAPLFVFLALSDERYEIPGRGSLLARLASSLKDRANLRRIILLGLAPAAAVLLILLFNAARFGHPLDFGLDYHNMGLSFQKPFKLHGGWSLAYLPRNVYYTVLRLPAWANIDGDGWPMGFSLFAQVPLLLLAFARRPFGAPRELLWASWMAAGLVGFFVLNIMGTGFNHFGARYLHDAVPMIALIIALKQPERYPRTTWALAAASIYINLWGSILLLKRTGHPAFMFGLMSAGMLGTIYLVAKMTRDAAPPATAA